MLTTSSHMRLATAIGAAALTLALSLTAAQPAAAAPDFTIEQALSAPFPSSLVAAGAGGRVAWVNNKGGSRNVWVAEPGAGGTYAARAISAYAGDDGYDLGELAFSPDGRQVTYSRGGSLEGGGPVNVLSKPAGAVGQEVWIASVDGTAPRRLGPGHSPAVSPHGDAVAYILADQIWTAPLAAGGQPAQLIHDRGHAEAIAWSPDGARLAFVSSRGDHSLVGVYDFAAKAIVWLGPSVDRDMAPAWSPDGRSLAYVRVAAGNANPFAGRHEAQPWSLWVADAATGAARNVWTASPGAGSAFHSLEVEQTLMWAADGRLVFPWERSGWLQLYAVSASGGAPTRLTEGDFEVFSATLSHDRKRIVYSSNQGDIDHRHVWEIALSGGAPRQLTRGATIEDNPAVASDGQVVALHGDWRKPIRPVSLAAGGRLTDLAPAANPADFPDARFSEPKPVVFTSPDGLQVHGQLFMPPPGRAARGPAILFFHGGPTRQMLLGWHPMDAYTYMYGLNQYLAREGYVVLSVNYRGGSGYGLDFREPPKFGPSGSSEFNDILGAAQFLRARPDVDPKRIGIWGGSYGGLMTALGLSRASDLLAAGVDYAGVHDWSTMGARLGPGTAKGAVELAFESSPMATIEKWKSPVLLVHADDDRNVPFSQTVELVEGLRKHGVEFEQIILPDEIHDLLRAQSWLTFFHATDDFFGRHLKPDPAPPTHR
ncbi:prolyl oligopeptidase family serine peptidase [Phenylobacterium sp.]|uniref:S9 family peptidase n=1 Tax=Phenylobacterium sp. TaxID=1871053 RepID=UPI003562CBF8